MICLKCGEFRSSGETEMHVRRCEGAVPHWVKIVDRFCIQETPSFPEGAPQLENYDKMSEFEGAVREYEIEWRIVYRCRGCDDALCPQCRDPRNR